MFDIKSWIIDYCIKTEICKISKKWLTHPFMLSSPSPLLEIANDVTAIVEKKKEKDIVLTYIPRHTLWCSALTCKIHRIDFGEEWEDFVHRTKTDRGEK